MYDVINRMIEQASMKRFEDKTKKGNKTCKKDLKNETKYPRYKKVKKRIIFVYI